MLRQHQQQLVMYTNRLVDAISDLVSDFQVLWRKPTTDSSTLQVSIEALDELLIFARIADKTGVIVNWFSNQGTDVSDKCIRQSSTAQECLWNATFRDGQCVC